MVISTTVMDGQDGSCFSCCKIHKTGGGKCALFINIKPDKVLAGTVTALSVHSNLWCFTGKQKIDVKRNNATVGDIYPSLLQYYCEKAREMPGFEGFKRLPAKGRKASNPSHFPSKTIVKKEPAQLVYHFNVLGLPTHIKREGSEKR